MKRCWILLVCSFLIHCGSSEVGNPVDLAMMDITDASTLYIASGNASLSRASSVRSQTSNDPAQNVLFKITEDGFVHEVAFRDADGDEITINEAPTAVINVSSEYVAVLFSGAFYLVRKEDGAVFAVTNCYQDCSSDDPVFPVAQGGSFFNAPLILSDGNANLYFISGRYSADEQGIVRVNVVDPEQLTREFISPETDNVYYFAAASDGTVAFAAGNNGARRIIKANGSLENIPSTYGDYYWAGVDGQLTFTSGNSNGDFEIDKLSIDSNFVSSFSDYGSILATPTTYPGTNGGYLLSLQDRIYIVGDTVLEVENPTQSPRVVTLSTTFNSVLIADASDNYYYISGTNASDQPVLIKVDPTTDTVTPLTTPGEFEIVDMDVSADDVISFGALRFNDGARVVGEIDADGIMEIREENLGGEIVSLERIR